MLPVRPGGAGGPGRAASDSDAAVRPGRRTRTRAAVQFKFLSLEASTTIRATLVGNCQLESLTTSSPAGQPFRRCI